MTTSTQLLSRDEFREGVFARDGHRCVVCGQPGKDAHHILERRLWPDGGYYLANGATVCEACHIKAEQTLISCEELRARCKIATVLLPEHLDADVRYDKWSNPILSGDRRLRGELFDDPSVQKILAPVLHLFDLTRVKYPRTYHLPWSPGLSRDDRVMPDLACFEGREVVVTVKMDGENTTFYRDGLHARSLGYEPHPSRDRVKAMHGSIAHDIPDRWRICGENIYAQHSIPYRALPSYLLVFSVWTDRNECLCWDETVQWIELLGLTAVPVIYRGPWNEALIRELYRPHYEADEMEGYVVRLADGFPYRDFRRSVAKYVRKGHVQTDEHWMRRAVVPNKLAPEGC